MKFTLKEIAERYKVSLSTIKNWNTTSNRILNHLAVLDLFIEETNFDQKDLEALKQLLNKKEDSTLRLKATKAEQKFQEYFWRAKHFDLAVELYALNISIQELKIIYKLKTGEEQ